MLVEICNLGSLSYYFTVLKGSPIMCTQSNFSLRLFAITEADAFISETNANFNIGPPMQPFPFSLLPRIPAVFSFDSETMIILEVPSLFIPPHSLVISECPQPSKQFLRFGGCSSSRHHKAPRAPPHSVLVHFRCLSTGKVKRGK